MKLILNNNQDEISIMSYEHTISYSPERSEVYNVILNVDAEEDINAIDTAYENTPITNLAIKNDDNIIVYTKDNLHLTLSFLNDSINHNIRMMQMHLTNV